MTGGQFGSLVPAKVQGGASPHRRGGDRDVGVGRLVPRPVAGLRRDRLSRRRPEQGDRIPGRVLSSASVSKVDGALSALWDAIHGLETLLAAAEPAKGHSALRTAVDLRLAQSTYDVLVARARMAGLFDPTHPGYGPGQNPPAGAGHVMSLAISA